jgi:hypothetical protein
MRVCAKELERLVEESVNNEAVLVFTKKMACRTLINNHRAIVRGDVEHVDGGEPADGLHGLMAISPESAPDVRWVLRGHEENSQATAPNAHGLTRRCETACT